MKIRSSDVIHIEGARQHNLKNLNINIPLNRLVAITGPSGSGKSTLAYHILYTEGHRRYVETFSPYSRQFLERLDKPESDKIEGIPPALAIEAGTVVKSSRSTVGTLTELTSFFKLLFSRSAIPYCPKCEIPISPVQPASIAEKLGTTIPGRVFLIAFPAIRPDRITPDKWINELVCRGFLRYWSNGKIKRLDNSDIYSDDTVWIVLDRLNQTQLSEKRLIDSITQALSFGNGKLAVIDEKGEFHHFTSRKECPVCGFVPPVQQMNLFSFNSPLGACPECRGFGRIIDIDMNLVIPDPRLSIQSGAIKPFRTKKREFRRLINFCLQEGIPPDVPFEELSKEHKIKIIEGKGRFPGVKGFFRKLTKKSYKLHVRVFLSRFRTYLPCPRCQGTRFRPQTLLFKVRGKTIAEFYRMAISDLQKEFSEQWEEERKNLPLSTLLNQIRQRLEFLVKIGLGYLTLERQSRTLSGGEIQRLHLTRALGSELVNLLYILDEPTIGLHPRDHDRLYMLLRTMVDRGNTVIVVDHEPEIVKKCDFLLDLGPAGGDNGGEIMFFGHPTGLIRARKSLTAKYLAPQKIAPAESRSGPNIGKDDKYIEVSGVSEHNLKDIDIKFPINALVCITGVSGSGKSTLLEEILYKGISREKGLRSDKPGKYRKISGLEHIHDVTFVDQHPIGKSPRSNLLTYIGIFSSIRNLFAKTEEAREMGLKPGDFSFNTAGGRCPVCKGSGYNRIEMQFMADVLETCPACKGTRYFGKILTVRYRGYNIGDIQNLTVKQALDIFKDKSGITNPLKLVSELGLDYIKLGQPLDTLSGGEAQRLKLVKFLRKNHQNTLFLLDEPTTGLHPSEIDMLGTVLKKLVSSGNTVVVVEHNLQLINKADWIIDLGPEGGDEGGYVVASGTLEEILRSKRSYTAKFLRECNRTSETSVSRKHENNSPGENRKENDKKIVIQGARLHNLDISRLEIPRERLVAITGISGSGKSTLAFDLIFTEGQRRYLECLSAYVRQYFKIMEKGDVDEIYGLPPTVAIEQRMGRLDKRSTVATVSEIYHFMRLLFSKLGHQYCPGCGQRLKQMEKEFIFREISQSEDEEIILMAPVVIARKGIYRNLLQGLYKKGYRLARIDGKICRLNPIPSLNRYEEHTIEVVVAKLNPRDSELLAKKLSEALALGNNTVIMTTSNGETLFTPDLYCYRCRRGYLPLDPRLFSFNSSYGACPRCEGKGVIGHKHSRSKAGEEKPCPICEGKRLKKQALWVKIGDVTINKLVEMTVSELHGFLPAWLKGIGREEIAKPLVEEMMQRLEFLEKVGLGYLQLNRSGDTLSGGETQRLRLAAQLGTNLKGVCYVLDEPTIGLHPSDHEKLLSSLIFLRDRGNTVIVVEHDMETIKAADFVVDLGPGAGTEGGKVIYSGNVEGLKKCKSSITGRFLKRIATIENRTERRQIAPLGWLRVKNASVHNLKNLTVSIPLGNLVCVTGVSGSGKSSLVMETIYDGLANNGSFSYASFDCERKIKRVLKVDHNPIGKTSRSIPATYVGFFNDIRRLFASTPEARKRGLTPSNFSFNVPGGRCEACQGQGEIRVSMNFLPDVFNTCEECDGRRYKPEILAVEYKDKNISEVLDMTLSEALEFFRSVKKIARPLKLLTDLGLGYLTLGQPSPTLSGGESQRIKLAAELIKNNSRGSLYVLDEPSTGLHSYDVEFLILLLNKLTDQGNTIIVIEHNPEIIIHADYIIDLGPGGGPDGGEIVASGTIEEILNFQEKSKTAQVLRKYLGIK